MVDEELIPQPSTRERIELMLPGIDKIWVRSSKGGWCVKGTEEPKKVVASVNEPSEARRRWWKFW